MDRSDPDFRERREDRVRSCTAQFQNGEISETVYRAALAGTFHTKAEIDDLVAVNRPFRTVGDVVRDMLEDPRGRGGFTSGLPERWP